MPYLKNEPTVGVLCNRGAKRLAWDENFSESPKTTIKKGFLNADSSLSLKFSWRNNRSMRLLVASRPTGFCEMTFPTSFPKPH
jgi:hypothetical protein